MALLGLRILNKHVKNHVVIASRLSSSKMEVPSDADLATGMERKQMEQFQAGNKDPFRLNAIKRQSSTKSSPNLIPSYYDCRIVGCVCEEESCNIIWMWLFKGEPRRCKCGHWFKLVEYDPKM